MGHQDHGCVERLELAFEPFQAGDVQVVRRLVEEQEVRVARERACQRRPRELAARERVQRPVELVVGEAETAHEAGGPLAPAPATRVLEPRLRPRVALHRRRGVIAARHRLLEAAELLLEHHEVAGAGEHVVTQRQRAPSRRPLVVEGDARALLEHELAAVQLGLAGEAAQERRLARAVGPGEGYAVAALDLERHAVEQRRACDLLPQVGGDDDCHDERLDRAYRTGSCDPITRACALPCSRHSADGAWRRAPEALASDGSTLPSGAARPSPIPPTPGSPPSTPPTFFAASEGAVQDGRSAATCSWPHLSPWYSCC